MNWTLIGVIVIFLINIFLGYKKGFIKILFSTVSIIVVLVITSLVTPKLSLYLRENTKLDDKLSVKIENYYEKQGVLKHNDGTFDVDGLPLPGIVKDNIEKTVNDGIDNTYDACNDAVVAASTTVIFSILVYIIFMLALYLVLGILFGVLKVFSRLPVLKQINQLFGMLIGLLQGLLIIWILFIIVTVSGNVGFMDYIMKDIDRNVFLTFLYDKNIIMNFLLGFF